MKNWFNLTRVVITFFIIYYLLSNLDRAALISSFSQLSFKLLLILTMVSLLSLTLRLIKWSIIAKPKSNYSYYFLSYIYLIGIFFSSFTPGKMGDLIKAKYLKKPQLSLVAAVGLSLHDRLVDLIIIAIFAILGIISLWSKNSNHLAAGLIVTMASLIIVVIIISINVQLSKYITNLLVFLNKKNAIFRKLKLVKLNNLIEFNQNLFANHKLTLNTLSLSLLIWLSMGWLSYLILNSFGYSFPILQLSFILAIGAIAGLIPISLAGLGVREGVIMMILVTLGVEKEVALVIPLLYTFFSFLLLALAGGILYVLPTSFLKKS